MWMTHRLFRACSFSATGLSSTNSVVSRGLLFSTCQWLEDCTDLTRSHVTLALGRLGPRVDGGVDG